GGAPTAGGRRADARGGAGTDAGRPAQGAGRPDGELGVPALRPAAGGGDAGAARGEEGDRGGPDRGGPEAEGLGPRLAGGGPRGADGLPAGVPGGAAVRQVPPGHFGSLLSRTRSATPRHSSRHRALSPASIRASACGSRTPARLGSFCHASSCFLTLSLFGRKRAARA